MIALILISFFTGALVAWVVASIYYGAELRSAKRRLATEQRERSRS